MASLVACDPASPLRRIEPKPTWGKLAPLALITGMLDMGGDPLPNGEVVGSQGNTGNFRDRKAILRRGLLGPLPCDDPGAAETAIDGKDDAVDVAGGILIEQKRDDAGDLARLGIAVHRNVVGPKR